MAHIQPDARRLVPAVVDALEEVVEELLLQADAVVGVKVRPVLQAVQLEPFLPGGGLDESLDVAPQVNPCPPQLPAESIGA